MHITTANLLITLADRAERSLEPDARAKATAATLRELAQLPALPHITAADLIGALVVLGRDLPDDDGPVTNRRKTCRELADLVPDGGMAIASVTLSALMLWHVFGSIHGEGPRIAAIKATARRELVELVRMAEWPVVGGFMGALLEACDALEARLRQRLPMPGDDALRPVPSRREPAGIVIPPRPSSGPPAELSDAEISRRIAAGIEAAKAENLASAWLDLDVDRGTVGRDGGPLVARVVAALRDGGYPGAALDGRSGLIEIPLG